MKKAYLINEQLDMIRATLYRQTMFAEFEKIVHEKIENKVYRTAIDVVLRQSLIASMALS